MSTRVAQARGRVLARTGSDLRNEAHRFVPHSEPVRARPADFRQPGEPPAAPETVIVAVLSAVSGGIMGFLFAGQIALAAAVAVSLATGAAFGWIARKLATPSG